MFLLNPKLRHFLVFLIPAVTLMLSAGCAVQTQPGISVQTLQGPAPVRSWTPMDDALTCLKEHYPQGLNNLRIGVGEIIDGTGQMHTGDSFSKAVTQRPDLLLLIGMSKTGVRLVNRSSTAVAEWELKQALEKRLGDGKRVKIDKQVYDYRPVVAGTLLGSTHYITGAITELNWNIDSDVAEVGVAGAQLGGRVYRISVAIDLIVTNTLTTEIVMARSYNKQLVGREYAAGLFRFFDIGKKGEFGPYELFEFNLGNKMNEPTQTALRWMFETAAYDIVGDLTNLRPTCDCLLLPGTLDSGAPTVPAGAEQMSTTSNTEKIKAVAECSTTKPEKTKAEPKRVTANPEKAKVQPERTMSSAEKAKVDPKSTIANTDKMKTEPERVVTISEKATVQSDRTISNSEKAKAEPERVVTISEKTTVQSDRTMSNSEKAKAEPERVATISEKATVQSDRTISNSEKAKAEPVHIISNTEKNASDEKGMWSKNCAAVGSEPNSFSLCSFTFHSDAPSLISGSQ